MKRLISVRRSFEATPNPERPRDLDAPNAIVPDLPLVTVVVPCFNQESFVADTIVSLKRQRLTAWECIVVDDASTDRSVQELWASIDGDKRFRVIRHNVNSGPSAARNTGIRNARAATITFLDADDLLMSDSLVDRYETLEPLMSDSNSAGTFCGVAYGREDTILDRLPAYQEWSEDAEEKQIVDFITAAGECPFPTHAPLIKTKIVVALGGFNEDLRSGAEDWEFWQRMLRNGYVFYPSEQRSALYRQRKNSMVRTGAVTHARAGADLIRQTYQAADPAILTAASEAPFPNSLQYYQEALSRARRAIRFAAIAFASGEPTQAASILGEVGNLSDEILRRHVGVHDEFVRGFKRGRGHVARDLSAIQDDLDGAWDPFNTLVSQACQSPRIDAEVPEPESIDALLVPSHPEQLIAMLALGQLQQLTYAVANTELETGSLGISGNVPAGIEDPNLNDLALKPLALKSILVGDIRNAHAQAILQAGLDAGIPVSKIDLESEQAMHCDGASSRTDLPLLAGGEIPQSSRPLDMREEMRLQFRSHAVGTPGLSTSWSVEQDPLAKPDYESLAALRNQYAGERCVIIGNGPSLRRTNLTLLRTELTFAVNGIFYARDRMGFDPTFYVVEDNAFMRENLKEIESYEAGSKLFPSVYRSQVGEGIGLIYFTMNRGFYERRSPNFCIPRFATNVTRQVYSGQSVTYMNLQLAYHMGFTEVILVGMDFSYLVPDSARVSGDQIVSTEDDPNHFHPAYFGAGRVWKKPRLDRVLASYSLAKSVFEADGRRIVNATVGGELELFERTDYHALLA